MSYSKIQVIGNLGKNPELRMTPGGQHVCDFSVAENRSYTRDGERVTSTVWYRISTWGRLAQTCAEYLSKGRQVFVEGQLQHEDGNPRLWGDPPRATFEIRADRVVFLSGGGESNGHKDEDPEQIPF